MGGSCSTGSFVRLLLLWGQGSTWRILGLSKYGYKCLNWGYK